MKYTKIRGLPTGFTDDYNKEYIYFTGFTKDYNKEYIYFIGFTKDYNKPT